MALLQPSGVSLDKKKKRSCPIATNRRKNNQVRLRERLKYEK
jgi:hypothetical protein